MLDNQDRSPAAPLRVARTVPACVGSDLPASPLPPSYSLKGQAGFPRGCPHTTRKLTGQADERFLVNTCWADLAGADLAGTRCLPAARHLLVAPSSLCPWCHLASTIKSPETLPLAGLGETPGLAGQFQKGASQPPTPAHVHDQAVALCTCTCDTRPPLTPSSVRSRRLSPFLCPCHPRVQPGVTVLRLSLLAGSCGSHCQGMDHLSL